METRVCKNWYYIRTMTDVHNVDRKQLQILKSLSPLKLKMEHLKIMEQFHFLKTDNKMLYVWSRQQELWSQHRHQLLGKGLANTPVARKQLRWSNRDAVFSKRFVPKATLCNNRTADKGISQRGQEPLKCYNELWKHNSVSMVTGCSTYGRQIISFH
jgi:hypothetical protein